MLAGQSLRRLNCEFCENFAITLGFVFPRKKQKSSFSFIPEGGLQRWLFSGRVPLTKSLGFVENKLRNEAANKARPPENHHLSCVSPTLLDDLTHNAVDPSKIRALETKKFLMAVLTGDNYD